MSSKISLKDLQTAVQLAAQVENIDRQLATLEACDGKEHGVTMRGEFPGPEWSVTTRVHGAAAQLREMARQFLRSQRADLMRELDRLGVTP